MFLFFQDLRRSAHHVERVGCVIFSLGLVGGDVCGVVLFGEKETSRRNSSKQQDGII